jgi:type IV pilus assembly protein PilY1
VLDAQTGDPVWRAIPKASGSTTCSGTAPVTCEVVGMDYSIPADITLVDRDFDGHVDRLYAADMGGNIWRVDLQPNGLCDPVLYPSQPCDPETWKVTKIAALGCSNGPCPAGTTPRKFFYPVDILSATATHPYDLVVAGSGDREHPLDENLSYNVTNRLYALKDGVGYDASSQATITENDLVPDPETTYDQSGSGYYLTLRTGEKVVNAPRTVAGATLFSTNMPVPVDPDDSTICEANLGEARSYRINAFTGGGEYATFDGGGFPPTVVAGVVNVEVGGKTVQLPFVIGGGGSGSGLGTGIGSSETSGTIGGGLDGGGSGSCSSPSALEGCIVNVPVPATRTRTYWYFLAD